MIEEIILGKLLQKYESSKHLLEPGASTRRVMLRTDKKDLPEYDYENADIRDSFNAVAQKLERDGLIKIEWFPNRPVFSALVLSLDLPHLKSCYQKAGSLHPAEKAEQFVAIVQEMLSRVSADWITKWKDEVCQEAKTKYKIPTFCKSDFSLLKDLLTAFKAFDDLHGETIAMRTFSSRCYHDTKYFERNIRSQFLSIAAKYNFDLADAMEQTEMHIRDQQAFLGIYARPELYELAGRCAIQTVNGVIDLSAAGKFGLAIPSSAVDSIVSFQLTGIRRIIFIENKTNYDEFLLTELEEDMLVVYHGGFMSPQKRKLISKLVESVTKEIEIYFWADIDLGGFRMFQHLQCIVPEVKPMRMGAQEVRENQQTGLKRDIPYLNKLRVSLCNNEFPYFEDAIRAILECGVTIEQECFLG